MAQWHSQPRKGGRGLRDGLEHWAAHPADSAEVNLLADEMKCTHAEVHAFMNASKMHRKD